MNAVDIFWNDLDDVLNYFEMDRNGQLPDIPQQALNQGREDFRERIDQMVAELLRQQNVANGENTGLIDMVNVKYIKCKFICIGGSESPCRFRIAPTNSGRTGRNPQPDQPDAAAG